jgi:chaperonin cofactor prefoldin
MAETLDTLAAKIDALGERIDARFEQADKRFEQVDKRFEQADDRFADLKAHLSIKIEAVDAKVSLTLEHIDDHLKKDLANSVAHARLDTRIDAHELRITALERGDRRKR